MNTTLIQINNPRSAFDGSWRFALVIEDRVVWASNPGARDWAERNAEKLWPNLELKA